MRTPAWMAAYAAVLALLGATYGALILGGRGAAFLFALAALAAVILSVCLAYLR